MRELDRVARERDCYIRHQIQAANGRRQGEWREHIVGTFEGEYAGRARLAQGKRTVDRVGGPE
jgi:hypothetical protein